MSGKKSSLINLTQFDDQMSKLIQYEFGRLSGDPDSAHRAIDELLVKIIKSLGCERAAQTYRACIGGGYGGKKPDRCSNAAGGIGPALHAVQGQVRGGN